MEQFESSVLLIIWANHADPSLNNLNKILNLQKWSNYKNKQITKSDKEKKQN